MTQVPATPSRTDPYMTFRFRVRWDGRVVAGVSRVSAVKRTTEVVAHRTEDSTEAQSRGARFEAITLEAGLTLDAAFHHWATQGQAPQDVVIEVYNEAGQLVTAYTVHRAWVSMYQALPALNADATTVAIEQIRLENEGWQRGDISGEPAEPDFPPECLGREQTPPPDAAPGTPWARLSQRLTRVRRRTLL